MPSAQIFNSAKHRDNQKLIAKYLNAAFETDHMSDVIYAIGNLARDGGMACVLKALGMQITIKPRREPRRSSF